MSFITTPLPPLATQAELLAGTVTAKRSVSPLLIAQAIAGHSPTLKVLAADESRTSTTTFADITGFSVPVVAGQKYLIIADGILTGGAGGWSIQTSDNNSANWSRCRYIRGSDSGGGGTPSFGNFGTLSGDGNPIGDFGSFYSMRAVYTAPSTGTLSLQFAQASSNAATSVIKAGATLEVTPLP